MAAIDTALKLVNESRPEFLPTERAETENAAHKVAEEELQELESPA